MIKVYHIIPTLGTGGAEDIVVNLANYTANIENNEVHIFVLYMPKGAMVNIMKLSREVKLHVLSERSKVNIWHRIGLIIKCVVKLLNFSPGIVHVHLIEGSLIGTFLQICSRKHTIIETFHTNIHLLKRHTLFLFRLCWIFRKNLVYEIGKNSYSEFLRYVPTKCNTKFIPFGTHIEPVDYDGKKYRFGILSRLRLFEKKFDILFDELAKLNTPSSLLIGGHGPDEWLVREHAAKTLRNWDVSFLGLVQDPNQVYSRVEVFIVVVVNGQPGIAGLKAIMCGCLVVGLETANELSLDSPIPAGFAGNFDALIKSVNLLSKKDKDILRKNQFEWVMRNHSIDSMTVEYLKIYDCLIHT